MKKFIILIIFILFLSLFGCAVSDQILAKKMIGKYSNNENYVTLIGEVVTFNGNSVVIKCKELIDYISYQGECCDYLIFSDEFIELKVGEQIEFSTVPFHFYNGHRLPIVEVKKGKKTLLSFEDGKENLINWVNANFK